MKNLVVQIITFILTALLSALSIYVTFVYDISSMLSGLSLLVSIPLIFIFYVIKLSLTIPASINGFGATFSDSLGIKITSIVLLVLSALLTLLDVYTALTLCGVKLF